MTDVYCEQNDCIHNAGIKSIQTGRCTKDIITLCCARRESTALHCPNYEEKDSKQSEHNHHVNLRILAEGEK